MSIDDALVWLGIDLTLFARVGQTGLAEGPTLAVLQMDAAEFQLVTGIAELDPLLVMTKSKCFPGYGCTQAQIHTWHDVLVFAGDMQKADAYFDDLSALGDLESAPGFIEHLGGEVRDLMDPDRYQTMVARQFALWHLKYRVLSEGGVPDIPIASLETLNAFVADPEMPA